MSECLTEEQLETLASETLSIKEAAPLRDHLQQCLACRELLEECRANLRFAGTVKEVLGGEESTIRLVPGSAQPAPAPVPADTLEGYQILRQLHRGAQGVVYYGLQQTTGRKVAIKFLREGPHASQSTRKRFEREIELVASLRHPNIIDILDAGVSPSGHSYYVMEYVRGLPLQRYVWNRKLTLEETLGLFVTVCAAINYAHQHGVLHRDLKPSNILVDTAGVPKVLDFGLAKPLVVDPSETLLSVDGQVVGTLPYMSPEQARGDQDSIDIRTDVYALGVILYKVLTGRYPYPTTGPMADVLNHIAQTPPTAPSRLWSPQSGVPRRADHRRPGRKGCPIDDDVDTIILQALAKDPARRYQNVATLMDDVSRYLHGQPIEARREAGLRVLRRSLARYKAAAALAGLGVLLITVFAVTLWGMYENQSYERQRADAERRRAIGAQVQLAGVLLRLGDDRLREGDLEEARVQYEAALLLNKHLAASHLENVYHQRNLAENYLRLGDVARRAGHLPEAADYYQRFHDSVARLAQATPNDPRPQDQLALSYQRRAELALQQGQTDQAAVEMTEAITIRQRLAQEPRANASFLNAYARLLLTCLPAHLRNPAEALTFAERAVEESRTEDPEILSTLALAYHRTGNLAQAEAILHRLPSTDTPWRRELLAALGEPVDPAATRPANGSNPDARP